MRKSKYIYLLNDKQITRSQMIDFIAANKTCTTIQITSVMSLDVAGYTGAEIELRRMQRIARNHRQYIAVGRDYIIEVHYNA
jgi:hypothetical protein